MSMLELIAKKRRGADLTEGEIRWFVEAVVDGSVPDYQVSSLLMAICYETLSFNETLYLTRAFVDSGETLTWDGFDKPVVDKHSTGGVGDSVSLLLLPWLAAEGYIVPKMSGRGLGHTGGTIDKLESIPGFRTDLSPAEMREVLDKVGCCVVQQSANLVPADKKLYALRDATGTVDEMGLIAASIVSKKIAAGADYIALDVKCGNGAFFKTEDRAREFAGVAIKLGKEFGKRIGCVISDMNQPLSKHIGNSMEFHDIISGLEFLGTNRDLEPDRLVKVAGALNGVLGRLSGQVQESDSVSFSNIGSGPAEKFQQWVAAQGGDYDMLDAAMHKPDLKLIQVTTIKEGILQSVATREVGELVRSMGGGRYRIDDEINPHVGIGMEVEIGDQVKPGETVGWIIADCEDKRSETALAESLLSCLVMGPELCDPIDPVIDVIL